MPYSAIGRYLYKSMITSKTLSIFKCVGTLYKYKVHDGMMHILTVRITRKYFLLIPSVIHYGKKHIYLVFLGKPSVLYWPSAYNVLRRVLRGMRRRTSHRLTTMYAMIHLKYTWLIRPLPMLHLIHVLSLLCRQKI